MRVCGALTATQFPFVDVLFKLDGQPLKAQIPNVQAVKAVLKLDPRPVPAQALWEQINEALKTDDEPPYFDWGDPGIYKLVGRPVTRADYEGTRGDDVFSRQAPGT